MWDRAAPATREVSRKPTPGAGLLTTTAAVTEGGFGGVTGPVPPWFGGPEASGLNCCDLFLECHEGNASSFPVKVLLTNSWASRNLPCHMLLPEDMEKQRVQAAFTKDPEKTALSESLALAGTLPVMDGLRQN